MHPTFIYFCIYCSFWGLLQLYSCQAKPSDKSNIESDIKVDSIASYPVLLPTNDSVVYLKIDNSNAVLRVAPNTKAKILKSFEKNDSVTFENRISYSSDRIQIGGINYQQPWLLVSLPKQQKGWVYGAYIQGKACHHPLLKQGILDQRSIAYFGPLMTQQIALLQKEMLQVITLPGFRQMYSRALMIKDSLEYKINNSLRLSGKQKEIDFFWLNDLLEGIIVYYIDTKNQYFLNFDFNHWYQLSLKTLDYNDDLYCDLMRTVYASDSIEYWYPSWQLELNDTTLCSLMGTGIYQKVLDKIQECIDSNSYFQPEIMAVKNNLILEMSTAKHYWLSQTSVLEELDRILQKNYVFFNNYDLKAIKNHMQLLKDPQRYGLKLNYFDGFE